MKKKIFSLLMSFLMVLSALTALIFAGKNPPESPNLTYASIEDELGEKFDLIGVNPNSYSNATIENTAPFDTEKSQVMSGSSLTPRADVFGQISGVTLTVNTFSLTASKSIYFWIYLIDTETFELTFVVTDAGEKTCQWFFDSTEVEAAGAGWSLFELKAAEAEVSAENTDRYSVNYKTFAIRYKSELTGNIDEYLNETDEFLSIYHVYTANSYSSNPYSGRVTGLSRAYSAFNSTFISAGKVFKGDEIELANPYTFFEYLMVGKKEYSALTNYSNYIWEITMQEPSGADRVMDYGDKFSFNTKGWYTLNIKLYEKKKLLNQPVDLNTVLILNQSKSIFCEEMTLGSFIVGTTYEMKDNEILKVGFKFTDGIIISGDIKVEFSNNCAELESQYELDGIYYIEVKGLEKGSVEMEVSATASSVYNKDVKKYSNEITIEVKSSEESKDWSITILWITFGCFCAYFGGFLINSLVKARKNDVK